MTRGWRRFVAAAALVTLVAAIFATPSNASGAQGVGSAGGSSALAALDAGDLLKLRLVGEQSSASIDPANGTPTATETLSPLDIVSGTLPALNALSAPSVSTTSTGAADHMDTALIDLASLPQPAPLLSGQINPASLDSLVDADGAHAALTSTLTNVAVAGGVAKVDSASLDLGGVAGPTQSTSTRTVTVNGVTLLDLRAVLQMLGLDLNTLPLSVLSDLIQQLELLDALNSATGQNFTSANDIVAAFSSPAITAAQDAVNTAQATLNTAEADLAAASTQLTAATAAATGLVCSVTPLLPLCVALQDAQDAFNAAQTTVNAAEATLNAALATLSSVLGQLQGVLDGIANTLELAPLLRIEGVQVGSLATAADSVSSSSATTTGTIGNIKVGGINLGGLDVGATVDQVSALVGSAASAVNNVLASISPKLANVVTIELFKHATDVSQSGSYVNAVAGITGVLATVTPPDVCGVLNDVLTQLPVGLNSLPGVTLPSLPVSGVLATLGSTLNCSVPGILQAQALIPAITTPITVAAAQANSVASFAPAQQTTTTTVTPGATPTSPNGPTGTGTPLARTGANDALFLLVGAMLLTVAYATRRTMVAARVDTQR